MRSLSCLPIACVLLAAVVPMGSASVEELSAVAVLKDICDDGGPAGLCDGIIEPFCGGADWRHVWVGVGVLGDGCSTLVDTDDVNALP